MHHLQQDEGVGDEAARLIRELLPHLCARSKREAAVVCVRMLVVARLRLRLRQLFGWRGCASWLTERLASGNH